MRYLIQLSLAAALSAFVHTASAAATDIAGIAVGTTLSSARSLLTKINPAYKTEEIQFSDGKTKGLKAVAEKDGKSIDQLIIVANNANIIWFVGRQQDYAQGQRIPLVELEKALIQKYGTPSDTIGSFRWQYDRDGNIYAKNSNNLFGPCPIKPRAILTGAFQTNIYIPDSFSSGCGKLITAELRESEKMVTQLITTVADMKRVFDELKAEEDAVKQAQQRQREQLYQQEKDNKPKL